MFRRNHHECTIKVLKQLTTVQGTYQKHTYPYSTTLFSFKTLEKVIHLSHCPRITHVTPTRWLPTF